MAKGVGKKIQALLQGRLNWQFSLFLWAAAWFLSLPPYGVPALAAAAFVFPVFALGKASRREVFLLTPFWAALFELATVWWIVPTISRFGGIPLPVALILVVLLCFYLGLFSCLFFVALKLLVERYGPGGACFAPFAWVVVEWLKGTLFGGFSWWGPGYALSTYSGFLQNAHLMGVLGLSFLCVSISSAIALLLAGGKKPAAAFSLLTLAILAAAVLHGNSYKSRDFPGRPSFTFGLVQPEIPQDMKWDSGFRGEIMERMEKLSLSMKSQEPDFVVWPESSIPLEWGQDGDFDERVRGVAREMSASLLFGTVFEDNTGLYNGAIMLDRAGNPAGHYRKTHLVPFGEYVPMEKILFFAGPLVESVGSFRAGTSLKPLDAEGVKLGVNICYEAIFPGLVRKQVTEGSEIIVNLSNDAWYEGTPAISQHYLMDRVRAVENFRYLVRSANGGYSAVIDPFGREVAIAGPGSASFCVGSARALEERSLYGKTGDWLPVSVSLVLVLAALLFGRSSGRGGLGQD